MSQPCRRDGPRGAGAARRVRIGRPILRHLLRSCRSLLPCTQSLNWGICPSSVTGFLKCVASCFTGECLAYRRGAPTVSTGGAKGTNSSPARGSRSRLRAEVDRLIASLARKSFISNDRPLSSMMRSTIEIRDVVVHATVRLGTPDASGVHVGSLERFDHAVPGQLAELPPFDPRGIVGQVGVGVATEALPLPEYANHTTMPRRTQVRRILQNVPVPSARRLERIGPVSAYSVTVLGNDLSTFTFCAVA